MKAISKTEFKKYGCVNCGCDYAYTTEVYTPVEIPVVCANCQTEFVLLKEGITRTKMGYRTGEDENNKLIFEHLKVTAHPRKGIKKHRTLTNEVPVIWCSVKDTIDTKLLELIVADENEAKKIINITKDINGVKTEILPFNDKENVKVRLYIKDINKLYYLKTILTNNKKLLTKEMIEEVLLMPVNFINDSVYNNQSKFQSVKYLVTMKSLLKKGINDIKLYEDIDNNPLRYFEEYGLYLASKKYIGTKPSYVINLYKTYLEGYEDSFNKTIDENTSIDQTNFYEIIKKYNKEYSRKITVKEDNQVKVYKDINIEDIYGFMIKLESILDFKKIKELVDYDELRKGNIDSKIPPLKVIYPMLTLCGVYLQLYKAIKFNTNEAIYALDHIANISIEDNPYQEIFDEAKKITKKYEYTTKPKMYIKNKRQL